MHLPARPLLRTSGLNALGIATLAIGFGLNTAPFGRAATLLIFVACCSRLSGVLLARGAADGGDTAARLTRRADREHLMRRRLGENLLLALVASAAGTLLAAWAIGILAPIILTSAAGSPKVTTLAFSVAATVVTTLAFGILPALDATRTRLTQRGE